MSQTGSAALNPNDFFGGGDAGGGTITPEQAFGPPSDAKPLSGDFWDGLFSQGVEGHVLSSFGQGFSENWGAAKQASAEETQKAYQSSGIFKDVNQKEGGLAKTFNEAFMRPAIYDLINFGEAAKEIGIGVPSAVVGGVESALAGGGKYAETTPVGRAVGAERIGETLAGMVEYSTQRGDIMAPTYLGGTMPAHLADIQAARSLGVIGEGEAGYFGTAPEQVDTEAQRATAVRSAAQQQVEQAKAAGVPEPAPGAPPAPPAAVPAPPLDIHAVAREIAPGTFQQYDALTARQATYRDWLTELGEQRAQLPAAEAAQARIDEILGKVGGVEERLTKAGAGRLADARGNLSDILSQDTPDMMVVRRNLLTTQHGLWDIAPDVRAAMAEAQKRMPAEVVPPAEPQNVSRETLPPQDQEVARTESGGVLAPSGTTHIGNNADGSPVFESANGLRSYRNSAGKIITERGVLNLSANGGEHVPDLTTRDERFEISKPVAPETGSAPAATFKTARGSTYQVHEDGTTTRNKAPRADVGHEGDSGPKARTARTVYVDDPKMASALSAAGLENLGSKGARVIIKDSKASLLTWNEKAGKWGVSSQSKDIPISAEPGVGKAPLELWKPANDVPGYEAYRGMHAGNAITELNPVSGVATPVRAIATDVSTKLQTAGRPAEEADAAAALVQVHYEARAARFGGAKGTAQDLYAREAPEIKAGKTRARAAEMAQSEGKTLGQPNKEVFDWSNPGGGSRAAKIGGTEITYGVGKDGMAELTLVRTAKSARNEGSARKAVEQFLSEADDNGYRVSLTPEGMEPGISKSRLTDFYKSLGFKENRGRSRDFSTRASMIREPKILEQSKRGSITLKDARNTIKLFHSADASTFIHETGHQWLEELTKDAADPAAPADLLADNKTVRDWLGVKADEAIPTRAHEKFARGFERYMMEGTAPTKALATVFAKFKAWLTQIYQTVNKLRSQITPEIRGVFDRLLVTPGHEPIIAGERATPESLADIHEREAESTPPHQADMVADNAEKETEQLAGAHAPEVRDELAGKARGIAAPGEGAPGGEHEARTISRETGGAEESGAVATGGGETAEKGVGARGRQLAFTRVPKEPPRLLDFIKRRGGIKDDRGDIATILSGDKKMTKRLLNAKGAALDDMTLAAWEAGYFPDTAGNRPTIQDMLEKIEQDYRGDPQYSEHDQVEADKFRDAISRNSEADRLANEMGIDPKDPDFWGKISDRMSLEELADHESSRAGAAASEFADAERRAKEYLESRGEAWEPDALYERANARTLEDLEREHEQEIAARNAGAGARGPEPSGSAPADQGPVQAGGGPSGNGAGFSGRAGSEKPTDPNVPIATTGKLIDKAGNIRLENLNTTEDARAIIRQLARDNMDFNSARFGDASYALYHEIKASGQLLVEASQKAAETYQAWADAGFDEAGAVKYAEASQQALLAAEMRSELTAGWGRAGHALQKVDRLAKAENVVDFIKRTTGKTLFQLREEGTLMNQLETPEQRAKFLADSRMTQWQKVKGGVLSYFINNLISGPITHAGYTVGNTVWALTKAIPTTLTAATIDTLRGAGTDAIHYREVTSQLYGMYRGLRDGIVPAARAMRTGVPFMKGAVEIAKLEGGELPLEAAPLGSEALRPQQIFPNSPAPLRQIGYALETPSRVVSAIHTLFYGMSYEQEIARRAVRSAFDAGLKPGNATFDTHVANFTQNPPEAEIGAAHDEALKMVLMKRSPYDSAMGSFQRAVNSNMAAKMIMPFMQIGSNLLREGLIEHTPLGLVTKDVQENLSGRNGPAARSTQYAKIAVGTGVSVAVAGLAWEGTITGGGPSDPRALAALKRTGWQPYSLHVGDSYTPYRKYLGPLGPLIGGVADMAEIVHSIGHETALQIAGASMFGLSEVVMDETWMSGLANFIDAARSWDQPLKVQRYLLGLATDFIPFSVGMRQLATLTDPYRREQETRVQDAKTAIQAAEEAAESGIPGWSQNLLPQRDVWGDPILAHTALGPSQAVADPVDQEFMRLDKYFPARLEPMIRGVRLTPEQYDDYSRVAGRYSKMLLQQDIESPGWVGLPDEVRLSILRKHLGAARETARSLIMAQNPGIIQAASAAKAIALGAVPPTGASQ